MTRHRYALATLVAAIAAAPVTTACAADPPSAVLGLVVDACGARVDHGSGMLVDVGGIGGGARPLLLTSAHVVAGASDIRIVRGDETATGTIVAFDPDMDLALLAVDGITTRRAWRLDSGDVRAGDIGTAYVVRRGRVVPIPVTIRRRINIRTEDVYIEGETLRPGFELVADIHPGDSGGAVVVDGRVVGVVWARSRQSDTRAYAIDPVRAGALIRQQLDSGELGDTVDLSRCG